MSKKREIDVCFLRDLVEIQKLQHWRISEITGIPAKKVTKFCNRYGIQTQRVGPRSGPGHPEWKGGRITDADGYILLYMPNHPNAAGGSRKAYIREHRHVMEQHLGRLLERSEVVHHKNHDKTDNRIENLMLFHKNSEHLATELKGKCPNWTEDGKRRISEANHGKTNQQKREEAAQRKANRLPLKHGDYPQLQSIDHQPFQSDNIGEAQVS